MDLNTDFFAAGMDGLWAITSRAYLIRELDLRGHNLRQNLMFNFSNVAKVAKYLHALQTGWFIVSQANAEIMQELVTKYSNFKPFKRGCRTPDSEVVVSISRLASSLELIILTRLHSS